MEDKEEEKDREYFVLALWDAAEKASVKEGKGPDLRALTGISYNTIHFNTGSFKEFADLEAVHAFLKTWELHFFFVLSKLVTVKVTKKKSKERTVEIAE